MHHCAKFHQNRSSGCEISQFFHFSRWRLSTILHLFSTFLDHPRSILVVFTGRQNLVGIHGIVLIICKFENFARLACKCLFTPPNLQFFGLLIPYMGKYINRTPKRHILAWKDVIWCTECQHQSTGVICVQLCMPMRPKKTEERNLTVTNWLFAQPTQMVRLKYNLAWLVVFRQ